jgi:hypothetical protein
MFLYKGRRVIKSRKGRNIMELSITIEIGDEAPNIELCGENCKFLKNGNCRLFDKELEEYGYNKIEDFDEKTITYEKTIAFHKWKRLVKCMNIFYSFGDS